MSYTCTIIISHFESLAFLRQCIRQTRKQKNPLVEQNIIISDQSNRNIHSQVVREYGPDLDVTIVWTRPYYSGFGLDHIFRNVEINSEYICQLHVDAFGISDQHLLAPIRLIEEYNLSFVGQLQFICDGTQSIYPPNPFFAMAQCYNVAKTETYKEMSLEAGFTRFHNRPQAGMSWNNNYWGDWANEDYDARGSDDDVVAFHWQDKYRTVGKLSLAISGYCEPSWGRIIDDLVFHFGSANEARTVMNQMPEKYQEYTKRINEDYSDALIDEMISLAKANRPPELEILSRNLWNGKTKISSPPTDEINKRIEELKNE